MSIKTIFMLIKKGKELFKKVSKKNIIYIICGCIVCLSCFIGGYTIAIKKSDSNASEKCRQLTKQLNNIEKQYNDRIEECNKLQQSIEQAGVGVDGCLDIIGQLRSNNIEFRAESSNARLIVSELRKRITEYENRTVELEAACENIKRSLNKQ